MPSQTRMNTWQRVAFYCGCCATPYGWHSYRIAVGLHFTGDLRSSSISLVAVDNARDGSASRWEGQLEALVALVLFMDALAPSLDVSRRGSLQRPTIEPPKSNRELNNALNALTEFLNDDQRKETKQRLLQSAITFAKRLIRTSVKRPISACDINKRIRQIFGETSLMAEMLV